MPLFYELFITFAAKMEKSYCFILSAPLALGMEILILLV